jgi:glycosyltransferase involved in cell wall biosynthesis
MKIIQVCTSREQLQRGAERFCLNLSKSLVNSNFNVTLVTGNRDAPILRQQPFPWFTIPETKSLIARKIAFDYFNPLALRSFKTIIEDIQPDIIHFHSFYGLSSMLARFATNYCPVIVTLHDSWPAFIDAGIVNSRIGLANSYLKVPFGYVHRKLNKFHLKETTLISPSLWMKEFFENVGFQPPIYIPNGIKDATDSTTYDNVILWVGTLDKFKGLNTIIDTISNIAKLVGWRFVVVGDGPHKQELETKYPEIFFAGYCDPAPYYKSASILLASSIGYENLPTVVLEGMQAGICIVGNNLGGIAELIHHDETGLLYRSVGSLAQILPSLINDPERIRRLGSSARQVFYENYQWDSCYSRYLNLYDEAISSFEVVTSST